MKSKRDRRLHFGIVGGSSHSIYAATDTRMYDYFPISIDYAKRTEMYQASFMVHFDDYYIYKCCLSVFVMVFDTCNTSTSTQMACMVCDRDRLFSAARFNRTMRIRIE